MELLGEFSEIFECLSLFCKDLNTVIRIFIAELATVKDEIAAIKKTSRVRWMNDNEQKNAEIRDILMADSGVSFVDLSRERTQPADGGKFDIEKAEQEFLFYHIHDYLVEPSYGDVKRLRECKYQFLLNYSEVEVIENVEHMKDASCVKLFRTIISFLDSLIAAIIEKQKTLQPTPQRIFSLRDLKSFKRVFLYGSFIIQHLSDVVNSPH